MFREAKETCHTDPNHHETEEIPPRTRRSPVWTETRTRWHALRRRSGLDTDDQPSSSRGLRSAGTTSVGFATGPRRPDLMYSFTARTPNYMQPGKRRGRARTRKHPRPTHQPQVGMASVAVFGAVGWWRMGLTWKKPGPRGWTGGLRGRERRGSRTSAQVDIFSFLLFYDLLRGTHTRALRTAC